MSGNTVPPDYCFVIYDFPYGGAEAQAKAIAHSVKGSGKSVELICTDRESGIDETDGIPIRGIGRLNSRNKLIRAITCSYRLIKVARKMPETIFVIFFLPAWLLALSSRTARRSICSIREYNSRNFNFPRLFLLRRFRKTVANHISTVGILRSKGIDSMLVNNALPAYANIEAKSFRGSSGSYLCVANMFGYKRVDLVIEAFMRLSEDGFKLTIVGKSLDDNYSKKLVDLIETSENIVYAGYKSEPELSKLVEDSEGLVHASENEGTSNAILAALASFKPVVVADTPENIVLVGGHPALLFRQGSAASLAGKVKRLHELVDSKDDELAAYLRAKQAELRQIHGAYSGARELSWLEIRK